MGRWDVFVAAGASIIAAMTAVLNTWLAIHNRNKITKLSVSIDGRMDSLLRATGAEGEAKGVAKERRETRDRSVDAAKDAADVRDLNERPGPQS